MDPSLDISKLSDADKADLQQQLANEQQKATIQQSKCHTSLVQLSIATSLRYKTAIPY